MALPCKDYGFGHFLMCFDSVKGFTKECEEAQSLTLKPKLSTLSICKGRAEAQAAQGPSASRRL